MEDLKKNQLLGAGAVLAAFGASLCCTLPIAVALLGVGSAALGAKLAPFRPWLAGLTVVFLGVAFYQAYKPVECELGEACAIPVSRWRHRIVVWIVALVALALIALPYYVSWLF